MALISAGGDGLTRKIAFVSALGGQGCSLSSLCVAKAAAAAGRQMILIDADGFSGTLAHLSGLGEEAVMHTADVLSGECQPEEALLDVAQGLRLMPSGSFSDRPAPGSVDIRRLAGLAAQEGDVIVDLPSGFVPDCGMTGCFDTFIICSMADAMSLKFSHALCRLIRKSADQPGVSCQVRLLLTRFSPESMRAGGISDIDRCIDIVGARLIGLLPDDPSAASLAVSGQPPDNHSLLMRFASDVAGRLYGERLPLDRRQPFKFGLPS